MKPSSALSAVKRPGSPKQVVGQAGVAVLEFSIMAVSRRGFPNRATLAAGIVL